MYTYNQSNETSVVCIHNYVPPTHLLARSVHGENEVTK